ncbi:MAG: energy-coupling factor transporter transmembrane protein EcfT [Paracoccaceae bacterium]
MLTLTSPVDTALHRWPAWVKLAALAVFTVLLFRLASPAALAAAAAAILALHLPWGAGFARHAARMLRPLWLFVAVVALWHLWLADPAGGAVIILRMTSAVAAANLVTMTTRLSDMLAVFERLATPFAFVLPPHRLALAFALVIRFIPQLSLRLTQIAEAFRARSPRRPGWRVLVPATLAALDDAEHAAEALRARGGAD